MATPTVVQTFTGNAFTTTSATATSGSNIQAGNVLVAFWITDTTSGLPANPSGCVTWTQAGQTLTFENSLYAGTWTVGPILSGGPCTVTLAVPSGGGQFDLGLAVWEVSGVSTVVDGMPGFLWEDTAFTVNGPSITTSTSGDMILAANTYDQPTVTCSSPFATDVNSATQWSNITPQGLNMAHLVQSSSGAVHATYVVTSANINMGIIALEPSGFQPDEDFWVAPPPAPVDSIISIF